MALMAQTALTWSQILAVCIMYNIHTLHSPHRGPKGNLSVGYGRLQDLKPCSVD
jgi:hypothetical protein